APKLTPLPFYNRSAFLPCHLCHYRKLVSSAEKSKRIILSEPNVLKILSFAYFGPLSFPRAPCHQQQQLLLRPSFAYIIPTTILMWILDVKTRWNSTSDMLNSALQLRAVCTTYCGSRGKASKYALHENKWDKILCCSKYQTITLEKPAPLCPFILNPQIKLKHFEKNLEFLLSASSIEHLLMMSLTAKMPWFNFFFFSPSQISNLKSQISL
ncbi:uncharacterized protein VP01_6256g1, partial [Puccinia sorghi]